MSVGLEIYPTNNLSDIIQHFKEIKKIEKYLSEKKILPTNNLDELDFSDVKGQENVKRALEVAAAGGHNCLLIGNPGSGKTMLAKRLPSILPDLSFEESLEITKIHSITGILPNGTALINTRPFRAPHHTVSGVALVGGGSIPKPR